MHTCSRRDDRQSTTLCRICVTHGYCDRIIVPLDASTLVDKSTHSAYSLTPAHIIAPPTPYVAQPAPSLPSQPVVMGGDWPRGYCQRTIERRLPGPLARRRPLGAQLTAPPQRCAAPPDDDLHNRRRLRCQSLRNRGSPYARKQEKTNHVRDNRWKVSQSMLWETTSACLHCGGAA